MTAMSRSSDRPPGQPAQLPPPATPKQRPQLDTYPSQLNQLGGGATGQPYPGPSQTPPQTQPAQSRVSQGHAAQGHAGQSQPLPGLSSLRLPELPQQSAETSTYAVDYAEAPRSARAASLDHELRAESRQPAKIDPQISNAPIVPAGSVTGRSLTLVISIMCFLACLTAGAVYMVNQSASAWLRDIASEVTVQIEPREKVDTDRQVKDVVAFLALQPGVKGVKPMSLDDSAALIEPWLGTSEGLKALPIPPEPPVMSRA